jgi:hypothetical protein
MHLRIAIVAAISLATHLDARANDTADSSWRWEARPYVWAHGFDGKIKVRDLPTLKVKTSFSEVLGELETGGMFVFEGTKGKYGILLDFIGGKVSDSGTVPPGLRAKGRLATTSVLLAGQYQISHSPTSQVSALVGLRNWSVRGKVSAPTPAGVLSRSRSSQWVDLQAGIKATGQFSPQWSGTGILSASLKDRTTWDLTATLNYATGKDSLIHLGYRYMTIDRRSGSLRVDGSLEGPIVGLSARF